jgi:hypothetical protein
MQQLRTPQPTVDAGSVKPLLLHGLRGWGWRVGWQPEALAASGVGGAHVAVCAPRAHAAARPHLRTMRSHDAAKVGAGAGKGVGAA